MQEKWIYRLYIVRTVRTRKECSLYFLSLKRVAAWFFPSRLDYLRLSFSLSYITPNNQFVRLWLLPFTSLMAYFFLPLFLYARRTKDLIFFPSLIHVFFRDELGTVPFSTVSLFLLLMLRDLWTFFTVFAIATESPLSHNLPKSSGLGGKTNRIWLSRDLWPRLSDRSPVTSTLKELFLIQGVLQVQTLNCEEGVRKC